MIHVYLTFFNLNSSSKTKRMHAENKSNKHKYIHNQNIIYSKNTIRTYKQKDSKRQNSFVCLLLVDIVSWWSVHQELLV